jgi:hypothetical protein
MQRRIDTTLKLFMRRSLKTRQHRNMAKKAGALHLAPFPKK